LTLNDIMALRADNVYHLPSCEGECTCGAPSEKPTANVVGGDGNAYAVMGTVSKALRRAGASNAYVDYYFHESTSSESYDKLLQVAWKFAELK